MDQALIDRIKSDMEYEWARTGPPEGFPRFRDIPTGRYISRAFHDLEQQHLWPRTWVMAGRSEDIPDPGDYYLFKDMGVPLLVVRGTDGQIRCFYNTCQHRGAPVVRDDKGSARRLRRRMKAMPIPPANSNITGPAAQSSRFDPVAVGRSSTYSP